MPYSSSQELTSPPFGLTTAFRVAEVGAIADTTPVSSAGGLGVVSLRVSIRLAALPLALVAPTALHPLNATHETPVSSLAFSPACGVVSLVHDCPLHLSASVTLFPPTA